MLFSSSSRLCCGHKLDFTVAETYGEEENSILQTARLWQQNVSVILGPLDTCVHEVSSAVR